MSDLDAEIREWQENDASGRRRLPAWLGSMILHAGILIVLALAIGTQVPGVVEEPARTTGIVLKRNSPQGRSFEGPLDNADQAAESADSTAMTAVVEALPSDNQSPIDPTDFLPSRDAGIGPAATDAAAGGGNVDISGKGPGQRNLEGGAARTEVFGLPGEGFKFVYVFDSSTSMSGQRLKAAKRELLASLESLERTHQFQIIFYNSTPTIFSPTGAQGRLVFATELNKKAARDYIEKIEAANTTRHEPALMIATRMQPDVIFFLTDGDFPPLEPSELRRVTRSNRGSASIHVIQFGDGAAPVGNNWLKQLASKNRGRYNFFHTNRLLP